MTFVISLNEFSLFRFLILTFFRRKVRILNIAPYFSPSRRILQWAENWATASGRASYVVEDFPDLLPMWEYETLVYKHDVFRKLEPWQQTYLDFDAADNCSPKYAFEYKQVSCKYFHWKYVSMFLLHAVATQRHDWKVLGVSKDFLNLCKAYFTNEPFEKIRPQWNFSWIINPLISIFLALYGVAWALSRMRFSVKTEDIFLAVDCNNDYRDAYLYEEVSDGGPVLLVMRNKNFMNNHLPVFNHYRKCLLTDGVLSVGLGLQSMMMILKDIMSLCFHFGGKNPELFFHIAMLPIRRIYYRALFTRFRPKYYWGRDDYQVEHILRRKELNRVGGLSFGINHAAQGICILHPSWRYISFDTYYVFGKRLWDHYKDTWPKDMRVRTVGAFGFSRAQLTNPRPTTGAIVFMLRFCIDNDEAVRMVRAVAKAFPNREILLQVKLGYAHDKHLPELLRQVQENRPNVTYTKEGVYELALGASYVLSDASTIIAEAIQIGVPTFMLDILPDHEISVYREFSGLCQTNAKSLVKEITALETAEKSYPREAYRDLVETPEMIIYDAIRQDMGLSKFFATDNN